jgi:hypothetical protein
MQLTKKMNDWYEKDGFIQFLFGNGFLYWKVFDAGLKNTIITFFICWTCMFIACHSLYLILT